MPRRRPPPPQSYPLGGHLVQLRNPGTTGREDKHPGPPKDTGDKYQGSGSNHEVGGREEPNKGAETSEPAEMPREEETRNQDINSKEKTAKQERIHEPETKTITDDIKGYTPRKEGESTTTQEETCGQQTCGSRPCSSP